MNMSPSAPLYDPRWEHDACGIGFVTRLDAQPSHEIVELALEALCNLEHRGALDADGKSGDGAGILTQIPYEFFAHYLKRSRLEPPAPGDLAVAMCFLPFHHLSEARALIEEHLAAAGIPLLTWRAVPTNDGTLGAQAMLLKPVIMQALLARPEAIAPDAWERALYRVRRAIGLEAHRRAMEGFYIASMSSRTIVYKGLMQASQLGVFYPDLQEPLYRSALAVYHQRYSTNTFPSWERAQPFRMLCHNGEINTLSGNVAAIKSREPDFASPLWEDVGSLRPVIDERGSDSAMLDNVLELLTLSGRDVRHALTMLVPPAWEHDPSLDEDLRAFFQFHSCLLAPWDGPAALCFADGQVVGMALDRNGLRPARYIITADGLIVAGSEVGAVTIDPERIVRKGRLGPGQMIAVDLQAGQFMDDLAIKRWLAGRAPYRAWVSEQLQTLNAAQTPGTANHTPADEAPLACLQAAFGYDAESLQVVLKPMARDGHEPVGSMGDDTPIAPLSLVGRPLYGYFRQRFAQVTNPPIDPLREALVMSLAMNLGPIGNLLDESPAHAHMLRIERPILRAAELQALRTHPDPAFRSCTIAALWPVADGAAGLQAAVWRMLEAIEAAIRDGVTIVILSDRGVDAAHAPIPALLAVGAAHHHLLRLGLRARVSLVLESGEPREVHHMACLIGYGAEAIHPYLAIASVRHMAGEERQREALDPDQAEANYLQALDEGLRKILSKMGISTIDSYHGAQLFEAIGIGEELIDTCFAGTPSRIGGIGWAEVAEDVLSWHRRAFPTPATLPTPGVYKFKKDGEYHAFSPQVVHALHQAVGLKPTNGSLRDAYRQYVTLLYERAPATPRDLLRWKTRAPIALEEVEPVEAILRRFSTAAMSIGATSPEAHEVLAIAMKRLGGMSNSGEGGEDPERYHDERNSDIKQVASGRFGVTPAYLMHARELQIKMAQGSKPGEGGQIPGHKVTDYIARLRHTTPGVTLISPPPHHDIYSIEDLAQLIYDLKQINPQADVSVKLVAEVGVGTVAAGVVKAGADVVHISGHSGGTGASPLSSIKNAGIAWELGLAETQQTLLLNGLRDRVRVRVDGGFQTGRDVIIAALLGADEYSFGTAAVVAEGCLMARTCHTNNCPVGIASQRPELRAKFPGTPENVMHFFLHLAEEVRELLAALGARTLDEIIGHVELLEQITTGETRADQLDLSPLLVSPAAPDDLRRWSGARRSAEVGYLNARIVDDALAALEQGQPIQLSYPIANTDRTVGATLAGEIARRDLRLAPDTIELVFHGSAGQSFGAFAAQGMRLILWGDANDYVGKGLGGGEIIVRPPEGVRYRAAESTIMGNTVLYGATAGALWAAGQAGERFAVRNSGALAVVEGIGDHGCEYMTGGLVVVLGPTGRNFGAGMSGGRAYVLDERGDFLTRINPDMIRVEALSEDWQFDELRALIEQHVLLTGSQRGQALLQQWASVRHRFWHVIPTAITPTPLLLRERRAVEQALTPVIA